MIPYLLRRATENTQAELPLWRMGSEGQISSQVAVLCKHPSVTANRKSKQKEKKEKADQFTLAPTGQLYRALLFND